MLLVAIRPSCHCEECALHDAATSVHASSLPSCQRRFMTIAEIATTGEGQGRRSRNDIKPTCHCEECALHDAAISAYARSLPCCQRHLMTIVEIATTGEVQVRRSRNDIIPTPAAKGASGLSLRMPRPAKCRSAGLAMTLDPRVIARSVHHTNWCAIRNPPLPTMM